MHVKQNYGTDSIAWRRSKKGDFNKHNIFPLKTLTEPVYTAKKQPKCWPIFPNA